MISPKLIQKYDVAVPRYTSYPTVPLWENNLNEEIWKHQVLKAYRDFGKDEGISLYIHLPYCENLCTYCGCNKRITKNHAVETPYIKAVMEEWHLYLQLLGERPKLAGIHLGGGTPTFFAPEQLHELISYIRSSATVIKEAEFSFEGHPNNTTLEHLQTLNELGFTRVSYGIQDFDEKVQKAIHRIQPFEKVQKATENAHNAGYNEVNFDLIYGLPHQTTDTIRRTFGQVADLKPDRIAFYSYAHVPTVFPAQKSFEAYLPQKEEKRNLYETGKLLLQEMGYVEIGMDHFALPHDPLSQAREKGILHRNFMGYTTLPAKMLIGLGNSAISDIHYAYAQNTKDIDLYKEQVHLQHFPHSKGHVQTVKDIRTRQTILNLMCRHQTPWPAGEPVPETLASLKEMESDGLIHMGPQGIKVTETGKAFIRNICAVFDSRMGQQKANTFAFSKAI